MTFNPCSVLISPNTPNHPTPSPTNECVGIGRETVRFLPLTLLLEQLATFIDGAVSRGRTADCVSFSGRQIPTSNRMTDRWPGNETQESQDWTIFLQNLEVWGNRVCFLFCLTSTLYWCYLDSSVGTIAFFFSRCYGMNKHDQRLDM